jgi:Uncharacterised protein family (UPF0236)
VYEFACNQAQEVAKVVLEKMDEVLMERRGEGLEVVGFRERWVITMFGQLRIKRRLYRGGGGEGRYLLDEAMGLTKRSPLSSGVRDLCALLASYMPFGKCEALLRLVLPAGVSHTTIHRQVGKLADPALALEDKEIVEVYEQGKVPQAGERKVPILFVESDGVSIALQRENERRAELKVGIAYEGWEKVGRQERYRLKEKTTYLGLVDGDRFWEGFSLVLSKKYDPAGVGRVVVGGDGAHWVRDGAGLLGGSYQLDRFHLRRELMRALRGDAETVNRVYGACVAGDVASADSLLLKAQLGTEQEAAIEIAKARAYILDNATGLADYRLRLEDAQVAGLRGLGAMEGNVDKLAANRMKKRGMSWTRKGIRRMACLIRLQQSGEVCSWPTRRTERTPFVKPTISPTRNKDDKQSHYATWLNMNMPALSGPYPNRPWARALRALAHKPISL